MPPLPRTCKEVTRTVLAGEDRRLGWLERAAVAVHLRLCAACPRFLRQTQQMRRSLDRWRAYRQDGGDGPV